ncbi:MAG TPA: G5 domain-containing protein [Bellilinea sp.]|nr:G5 domain-containing protein [Bellilinea sp.]
MNLLLTPVLIGCTAQATPTPELVPVTITDQGKTQNLEVTSGTNVQSAIQQTGIVLTDLDRTEPPTFTLITAPQEITIIRVTEEFEVEENVIPYDHQTVRNETLPEGNSLLIQPGENGLQQITYRRLLENNIEVARTVFKSEIHSAPITEIIMIGVQAPFSPLTIPGRLAYINGGNAWLVETTTSNRVPAVTTGDLDGRIFSLSPDRSWLLFTRSIQDETNPDINTLWVANLSTDPPALFDLGVRNVVHYADWSPNAVQTVLYSSVEPRSAAPGWQANNDLRQLVIGSDGIVLSNDELISPNTGGIYGWWGTNFEWSLDGLQLAYARPDSVGLVNFEEGSFNPLVGILPYQTRADWAWVPPIAWSADSQQLFVVTHQTDSSLANPETAPIFNLESLQLASGLQLPVAQSAGMFANPSFSPSGGSDPAHLAYLEAIFPEQSGSSRYRLYTMDQDGSNPARLYPLEGSNGLDPQKVIWAPGRQENQPRYLAFLYQGNIWLIDIDTTKTQQITGDGLVSRMDWE